MSPKKYSGRGNAGDDRGGARDPARRGPGETAGSRRPDSASQYKVVKAKIDKSLGDTFIDWVEEKKLGAVFRVITDYKREYPMNNLLSSVLGFVGADNLAKEGLEVKYDEVLSGTPGRLVTALNAWGDELPTRLPYENTVDAEDGYSLVLTVDQTIQQITEKYLEEAINQYAAKNRGAAIVMDVQTGAILAMATKRTITQTTT